MLRIVLMLAAGTLMAKPPKTDRCLSCDLSVHHPGRLVRGCNCSDCWSGTGQGDNGIA